MFIYLLIALFILGCFAFHHGNNEGTENESKKKEG
jgi:hypothetical protein